MVFEILTEEKPFSEITSSLISSKINESKFGKMIDDGRSSFQELLGRFLQWELKPEKDEEELEWEK